MMHKLTDRWRDRRNALTGCRELRSFKLMDARLLIIYFCCCFFWNQLMPALRHPGGEYFSFHSTQSCRLPPFPFIHQRGRVVCPHPAPCGTDQYRKRRMALVLAMVQLLGVPRVRTNLTPKRFLTSRLMLRVTARDNYVTVRTDRA